MSHETAVMKHREEARLYGQGILPRGLFVSKGVVYALVTDEDANRVIDTRSEIQEMVCGKWRTTAYDYTIRGKFLVESEMTIPGTKHRIARYVAIDNEAGDAWTEEFYTRRRAVMWLTDGDTDTNRCKRRDFEEMREKVRVTYGLNDAIATWLIREENTYTYGSPSKTDFEEAQT